MRIRILILVVCLSLSVSAQKNIDPFVGGVEFGIGYGTVIDFNLDNNNFHSEHLLERLFYIPFQIGFVSAKYLNPNKYVEFGILYSRKGSSYVERLQYSAGGVNHKSTSNPALALHCIDLPIKYYFYAGKILKRHMYAFGGLIPSWLVEPVEYTGDFSIPEDCYRNLFLSVCGGLCFDKKKSRMKLHAGMAVTSIVNSRYREIPEENRDYGSRIYPFELLFCYAHMFK